MAAYATAPDAAFHPWALSSCRPKRSRSPSSSGEHMHRQSSEYGLKRRKTGNLDTEFANLSLGAPSVVADVKMRSWYEPERDRASEPHLTSSAGRFDS